ncbi:hypothetical protein [Streptomyces sp. NPDC055099]
MSSGSKKNAARRTVSFFRVVKELDGTKDIVRLPDADWQDFLGKLASRSVIDRTYQGPTRRLIGEVLTVDETYALKLMEPRDENSWLEILRQEEAAEPVNPDSIGELVETTVIVFLDRKNIVGIIRGSTSSPTHTALGEWLENLQLDGQKLFDEPKGLIRAEAALTKGQRKKLRASDGVSETKVRISTSQAEALEHVGSEIMADTLKRLRRTYGDIFVTVTLRVPRGKAYDQARRTLKDEALKLQNLTSSAESVSATLVTYDEGSRSHQEEVDFISQRITAKKSVPLTGDDGEPIRNSSAVRAIIAAAEELRVELDGVE